MKILFATSNENKANEIRQLLPSTIELITLKDIEINEDIPETSPTIEGNAKQKADYITMHFNINCFADDTGLEINALNGEPGVFSARYAGEQRSDTDNMQLVLDKLPSQDDRSARFKTVIALNVNDEQYLFEGIVNGTIRTEKTGANGFGYDPIFEPENCGKTFGEMDMDEKNSYSHRARAIKKMITFMHDRIQPES
ncbi:MAG: RdgB/HAM1 family non-canonical purine NTP pyrophosphatase [Crocinitomicaceae bacterium]